jgi:hypothetical protein
MDDVSLDYEMPETGQIRQLHSIVRLTSETPGRRIILQPLERLNNIQGGNTVHGATSIQSANPLLILTLSFGISGDFNEISLRSLREWIFKAPPELTELLLNRIALAGPSYDPCLARLDEGYST